VALFFLLLLLATTWIAVPNAVRSAPRGTVIQDFESGSVVLRSYPDQDQDPDAWEVTGTNPHAGAYALRIDGNSWKIQDVPPIAIADTTLWQVAVFVERLGEMQAFGVGDGQHELLYTMGGEQLPQDPTWWTVYQGAFPTEQWFAYLLPIGRDWQVTHGYLPTLTELIYVNDDDSGPAGATLWDSIADVTEDQPVAPAVEILYTIERTERIARDLLEVTCQFHGLVHDPDSPDHTFAWDFGDSTFSDEPDPLHVFLVAADYTYTVGLVVRDELGLAGVDTCQVRVTEGSGELPLSVNFVGDIFTGRRYEEPGGIIETYGIEALFSPTLGILGQAADVNVANLECAYTTRGEPHPTKSVVFRSRPENIAGIGYAGIDVVTIGNNHIVDYGEVGMLDTMALLDSMGVCHSGAGTNEYFALLPTFWTEKGVRLAFLGQCNRCGRAWNYQPFLDAGASKPGFGYLLPHNLEAAIGATRDLTDIVIIQLHSGDEYETAPPPGDGEAPVWTAPPPVEAATIEPHDPDFRFRVEPTLGERELRRLAIDLGADVVINHHPHVLQGFESYAGKLIAHSLGNFIFDLYYPETMPTLVLTLEIDKQGVVGATFVPAWIDDDIPQPATGQLAREIMDRIADYSRPMDALVAVDPELERARVHTSRAGVDSLVQADQRVVELEEVGGQWLSPPVRLAGAGNLSRIVSASGAGGLEVAWGREILWHGGFEAEGATLWDDNTDDEWLDDTVWRSGARSLALRRHAGQGEHVGTDLERHLPCDPQRRHTALGYLRADNTAEARIMVRFYHSRYSEDPLASTDLAPRFTGTCDWTAQWTDLDTPNQGVYFELRCAMEPPSSGTGLTWFDDLALVEWEDWVTAGSGSIAVPSPNNHRYLQVRASGPGTVAIVYEETAYTGATAAVAADPAPPPGGARLSSHPNPFNPRTTLELDVPGRGAQPVEVAIFDVLGRRVATLFEGELPGGQRSGLSWDGRDAGGRPLPSGIYLARGRLGRAEVSHKLVLIR
jgi:poly-gamma-glutamate synthesis protein (capsule biosynthesis protein)